MLKDNKEYYDFYKNDPRDRIWWTSPVGAIGEHLFSFDKEKIFNLFRDYPHELTKEERDIFEQENPYWVEFFKDRI